MAKFGAPCTRLAAVLTLTLSAVTCRARRAPIDVRVVFENSWRIGTHHLTDTDVSVVRRTAMRTMQDAYDGFAVRFTGQAVGDRLIKVEDTPFSPRILLGAAGLTYPVAKYSSVRFDVLCYAALAAARCEDFVGCAAKTRDELLEGLGRGIGATAAHELGHQAGFRFALDSPCSDCYDGRSSTSADHFFRAKHWSPDALTIMRRVLPAATAHD